jgi:pyruvate carboxylase subunit B
MPGRVVKILVSEGEVVARGAPTIIVEAMKMENELHAPTAGVVRRVAVREGDTVDAGQVLVEISPPDAERARTEAAGRVRAVPVGVETIAAPNDE